MPTVCNRSLSYTREGENVETDIKKLRSQQSAESHRRHLIDTKLEISYAYEEIVLVFLQSSWHLFVTDCSRPRLSSVFLLVQCIIFFALFYNFYRWAHPSLHSLRQGYLCDQPRWQKLILKATEAPPLKRGGLQTLLNPDSFWQWLTDEISLSTYSLSSLWHFAEYVTL